MKKVAQQFSPRSQSPRQQYFNNRLGGRVSPKGSTKPGQTPSGAASPQIRQPGVLNAPIATSRQNRSKSIRQALESIKQRSISKSKPTLSRLLTSVKSVDKLAENIQKRKEKSPASRPLTNITGSFLNKTTNGFSKIKPIREAFTKDTIKLESLEGSRLLKSSILQPPSQQSSRQLACKEVVDPKIRDKRLQDLLFGRDSTSSSSSYIIQDSEDRSELGQSRRIEERESHKDSLLLQENSCSCGCRTFKWQGSSVVSNQLKKRLGRLSTQTIFDYIQRHCRNRQSIPFSECKELLSRFLVCSNIVYRYEDLHGLLQQLYDSSCQLSKGVCFRKVGRFLRGFTETDRNRINCVWEALHREFISVGELKVIILHNHTRTFYESVRDAFNRCAFKDDEQICYWDLYSIRELPQTSRLVELLWESSLMGTEFRISHSVPERLLTML